MAQARCGGDFEFCRDLRQDLPKYRLEKEKLVDEVCQKLDEIFPGFASCLEMIDVASPLHNLPLYRKLERSNDGLDAYYQADDD